MAFDIEAVIDGKRVPRAGVLAWENRCITASAKKLDVHVSPGAGVMVRREELACPDHYVLRTTGDGRQQVMQATGANPILNQFFLTYGSDEGLANAREPQYPQQIVASARLADGTLVGGARMQFRDTRAGFFARLIEEFPALTPGFMIKQQRWHTALEFSNWTAAAHAQ